MAESYTLFSTCFILQTSKEQEWFKEVVALTHDPEEKPAGLTEDEIARLCNTQDVYGSCDVDIEGDLAYLCSEEQGSTDYAECIMQLYLCRFHPKAAMTLEVAYACSKSRPGEFGGAAAYITASNVEWMSTQEWIKTKRSGSNVTILGK
jgi:hypothetical protein